MKAICKTNTFQTRLNKTGFGTKYFYKLNVTYGFIVGIILDQILIGTFGYPIKLLKGFGRSLYSKEIKLNKYTNNFFIRGFLE
jgi:hypothetical protein